MNVDYVPRIIKQSFICTIVFNPYTTISVLLIIIHNLCFRSPDAGPEMRIYLKIVYLCRFLGKPVSEQKSGTQKGKRPRTRVVASKIPSEAPRGSSGDHVNHYPQIPD